MAICAGLADLRLLTTERRLVALRDVERRASVLGLQHVAQAAARAITEDQALFDTELGWRPRGPTPHTDPGETAHAAAARGHDRLAAIVAEILTARADGERIPFEQRLYLLAPVLEQNTAVHAARERAAHPVEVPPIEDAATTGATPSKILLSALRLEDSLP